MFNKFTPNADKLLHSLLIHGEDFFGGKIERVQTKDGVEVTFVEGALHIRINEKWLMPVIVERKWWQFWKSKYTHKQTPLPPIPLVIAFANKGEELIYWEYNHLQVGEVVCIKPLKLGTIISML